jgi:uncharacterized membrane protein YczE
VLQHAPGHEIRARLPRLLLGLVLCGVGIAALVRAELGLGPWDVLHQGVAERSGLTIGSVTIIVGLAVLTLWLPLREQLGLGTVLNVIVIGLTVDATLVLLAPPDHLAARWALLLAGLALFAVGSGFYIGAGLGPGPRDGLMTGLARHGHPLGVVRLGIEVGALCLGWALGGTVGVGTVVFAFGIGPMVHVALDRMGLPPIPPRRAAPELSPEG